MTRIADAATFGSLVLESVGNKMANTEEAYKVMCTSRGVVNEISHQIQRLGGKEKVDVKSYVTAMMTHMWRWGLWAYYGYNVFDLTASLAAGLLLTEPAEYDPDELHFPFPTFCVRLPPGAVHGVFDGQKKSITQIWVSEGRSSAGERVINFMIQSEEDSSRRLYELWRQRTMEKLYEKVDSDFLAQFQNEDPFEEDNDRPFDMCIHLVRNFCAWLDSQGGLKNRKPSNSYSKRGDVPRPRIWSLGHEVKLSKEVREAASALSLDEAGKSSWKVRVQFVVRGHWRNQAHGPGRSLRRRQWIEPFFKGPENAEAWAHLYKTKG